MGRMSLETRAKVIRLKKRGMPVQQIAKHLDSEGVYVSKVSLYTLFKKYKATHCIQDQKRRSRPQLLNDDQYRFINNTIANNVDMTSRQLHTALISIVIFMGIMNATIYTDILQSALVPFIEGHYPDGHRFQQDNDPKHTSRWAQDYFERKGIN